jgi:small subunit ribosomal protein S19e
MTTINEVAADKLIEKVSKELEKMPQMKPPEWAGYVKTGVNKERVPVQENWWYLRSASVLRKISLGKSIGVSKLRKEYGSRKRRGHKRAHKYNASGSIIRKILQQLESSGLLRTEKGKGRTVTRKGKEFLKSHAGSLKG